MTGRRISVLSFALRWMKFYFAFFFSFLLSWQVSNCPICPFRNKLSTSYRPLSFRFVPDGMPLFIFSPALFAVSQLSCNEYGSTNSLSTCFAHALLIILLLFLHKCPCNISSVFSQQNVFMCAAGELPSENLKLPLCCCTTPTVYSLFWHETSTHIKVLCWGCLLPLNWRCKNSAGKEHQLQISFSCPQLCRMLPCC